MLKLIALSCLLVQAYAGILPDVPGHAIQRERGPTIGGRLVGGNPADITTAPYTVALLLDLLGNGAFNVICGGSIIRDNVILSAAHCAEDTTAIQWRIRAGSTFTNSGGQLKEVARTVMHPQFDVFNLDYDISLFFLTSPIVMGRFAAVIHLPTQDTPVVEASWAFITGWGSNTEGGDPVIALQRITVPVVNHQLCQTIYQNYFPVTERMICAGVLNEVGCDICHGDEGTPLVISGYVSGIGSWGRGCGRLDSPGVFTKVSSFSNWISSQL